eukprot:6466905-Amphidinium_carterae.2
MDWMWRRPPKTCGGTDCWAHHNLVTSSGPRFRNSLRACSPEGCAITRPEATSMSDAPCRNAE